MLPLSDSRDVIPLWRILSDFILPTGCRFWTETFVIFRFVYQPFVRAQKEQSIKRHYTSFSYFFMSRSTHIVLILTRRTSTLSNFRTIDPMFKAGFVRNWTKTNHYKTTLWSYFKSTRTAAAIKDFRRTTNIIIPGNVSEGIVISWSISRERLRRAKVNRWQEKNGKSNALTHKHTHALAHTRILLLRRGGRRRWPRKVGIL